MRRYLAPATTPAVSGRYSLAVLPCAAGAATEAPLTPAQLRMLASYEGRDPEPFKLEAKPARGRFQGWRVP